MHPNPKPILLAILAALAFALSSSLAASTDTAAPPTPASVTPAPSSSPAPRPNTAIIPVPQRTEDHLPQSAINAFNIEHAAYSALAKKGGIDVLFLGDSITDGWHNVGQSVWQKYYGSLNAANFGVGWDRTQHVLWRLQNGEGEGFQPKVVVLLIGTNNAGVNTTAEAAAGVAAVVHELRQRFPAAKILLLGILPRGNPTDAARRQVADINQITAKLNDGQHVFYLDLTPKFLDASRQMLPGVMHDTSKLHPSAKGYEIWAEAIQPLLTQLLPPATPPTAPAR
jgi:lysophospholipase L1-like esterase